MSESTSLIEAIRERPGMYFGSKSLTALHQFLNGFQTACVLHGIDNDRLGLEIPQDFNDWVAYRTHFREPTSGWCNMILASTSSEEEAFDRFFELIEEHLQRVPKLVAEILRPVSNKRRQRDGKDYLIPPPKRVQLVKYTDDRGFFALYESKGWFHPYLSWMLDLSGGELVVHDEEAYGEMIKEDAEWERSLEQSDIGESEL